MRGNNESNEHPMAQAPRNLNYLNQKQWGLVKSTMETIRFNNKNNEKQQWKQ